MDYEQLQRDANDENRNLLVAFAAIISVVAAAAAATVTGTVWGTLRLIELYITADASSTGRAVTDSELLSGRAPWGWVYVSVFAITASVIVWVSHSRERALIAFGGAGIAHSMGGRRVDAVTGDTAERRFVNTVEEMAIAASQPAPVVYVLDREQSINAFNAGWTHETTVIGITNGALVELSREELQAVAAQAMSHVFHGDARLNLRLMALVTGVAGLAMIGEDWIDRATPETRTQDDGVVVPLLVAGWLLYAVGWIGVSLSSSVQRSVARRHELLADATAIELLRLMDPVRDALRRIGGHPSGSRIRHRNARSTNHLFMADAGNRRRGGVHPDLRLRVLRLDPAWSGSWIRPDASDHITPDGPFPTVVDTVSPGSVSPGSMLADPTGAMAPLAPMAPVFDAMSAPIAGLSQPIGAVPGVGSDLLAPVLMASLLGEPSGPGPDASQARCMVVALTHLAAGRTPTPDSVPKPCTPDQVTVMLDVLQRAVAADPEVVDRVAMLTDASTTLRGQPGIEAFAEQAVDGLRVGSDLDQWILQRLILGNLITQRAPKKLRPLERLRSDYASVLSTLAAIGGGNTQAAFDVAVGRADLLGIHQRGPGKLSSLSKSLDKLAAMEPRDHERALNGLMGAMHADGESRRSELEFIEVVRLTIEAPEAAATAPPAAERSWTSRLRSRSFSAVRSSNHRVEPSEREGRPSIGTEQLDVWEVPGEPSKRCDCLGSSECCAEAVVDAATECEVRIRGALDVERPGSIEHRWVLVGGTEKHDHRVLSLDCLRSERDVRGGDAHGHLHW